MEELVGLLAKSNPMREEILEEALKKYPQFPERMQQVIRNYVLKGDPLGHFLTGIFSNDLLRSIKGADDVNINLIKDYIMFVYWELPENCWGSIEQIKHWQQSRREK